MINLSIQIFFRYINSFFYFLYFKLFGAHVFFKSTFRGRIHIQGFYSNIYIGKNSTVDNNVKFVVNRLGKIKIGTRTLIGDNVIINAGKANITIGNNTMIAANTYIINNDHEIHDTLSVRDTGHVHKDVIVGDNCWIGANVTVLKGVTINEGAIIGAGSVVNKDIPPYSIAVGNPCKVIKKRFSNEELAYKLKKSGRCKSEIIDIINFKIE